MQIKIVGENSRFKLYECKHIGVTKSPGRIEVELCPGPTLVLPDDGEVIYVINDNARTTDTLRVPAEVEEAS